MSLNINKAVDIASHAALGPYMNDGGLEDIVRAALEAVGPWIAAQALRDEARRELGLEGLDDPYTHDWLTREKLTDRADEIDQQ